MIEYLKVLSWPVVALTALFVLRPALNQLLSGSTLKVSIAGVEIETTLPEIRSIISEQIGGDISEAECRLLIRLVEDGEIRYRSGTSKEDRKLLRPLRNAGLIMTIPRQAFLADAKSVQLTSLGKLYSRAMRNGEQLRT